MTKRILLAGLVIALCCLAVPAMAIAANYAFTPNMGQDGPNNPSPTDQAATVSKVDAINNVEIARYYTVPRYGQMVDAFGNPSAPFPYYPGDWRTNRLIVSTDGDAWVLNTGADEYAKAVTIQGTVVRIQGETTGLGDTDGDGTIQTANTTIPLTFGTDDAVTVFAVGALGDIPRTINFDSEGNLWIGFHKAGSKYGYFQKYTYDPCYNTLTAVEGAKATSATYDLAPYNADIDKNGILWFASYGTGRINRNVIPTNSDDGVYSFDTNNPAAGMTYYPSGPATAYGILVDDSPTDPNVKVYATSLEGGAQMWIYDSTTGVFTTVPVVGGSGLRGLAFDNYGTVWIASSSNGVVCWYNPDDGTSGYYTGVGTTPVGVGKDYAGDMWVVVRNANKLVTFTPPATPTSGASVTTIAGFQNVPVGPWPYVYGDFIREPVYYQICGYKYEFGTDPSVGLEGWTINLYKEVDDEFPEVPTATTVTDEYGHYCFTGLEAGLYKVTESYQEAWYPVVAEHAVTLPDSDPCNPVEISYDFINAPIYTYCETVWAAVTEPGTERFVHAPGDWATYINDYTTGTGVYTADNPKVYPLFAGQTHPAGELWVYDSGGTVFVKYVALETDPEYKPDYCGGWKLSEYHLQVVDEFNGFDAYRTYNTKTNSFKNPIPGSFTNKWEGDMVLATEWIPIDISAYTDSDIFIAAHGVACWQGVLCSAIPEFPS